jgi:hypothetical protein
MRQYHDDDDDDDDYRPAVAHRSAGRGAYAICALPDLCVGITRQLSARCGGAAP